MKIPILGLIILYSLHLSGQMFTLPIYLFDSKGNRDTVFISGDPDADSDLNSQFGEVNINGVPYDSIFEARLTNDVFSSVRIESKKHALYYSCPSIDGGGQTGFPLLVRCMNWPLTVKWDRKIVDSLILCISESGISNKLSYFGGQGPLYKLSSRDSVIFSEQSLTSYFNSGTNNGSTASIYVVAIGINGNPLTTVAEPNESKMKVEVYFDELLNTVTIEHKLNQEVNSEFFVADLEGRVIAKGGFGFLSIGNHQHKILLNDFRAGMYIVGVNLNENRFVKRIFKSIE